MQVEKPTQESKNTPNQHLKVKQDLNLNFSDVQSQKIKSETLAKLKAFHEATGSEQMSFKKAFLHINQLDSNNIKLSRQNPGHNYCIQTILEKMNYYDSYLDGRYGPKTKEACKGIARQTK